MDHANNFLEAAHREFQDLFHREFQDLFQHGVLEIVPVFLVPERMKVFSAVRSMRRKCRVRTREVYKYKARLNLDGSQMQPGRDYDLTTQSVKESVDATCVSLSDGL
jgi:hypothetical protein